MANKEDLAEQSVKNNIAAQTVAPTDDKRAKMSPEAKHYFEQYPDDSNERLFNI
jgi:hypothetical protein